MNNKIETAIKYYKLCTKLKDTGQVQLFGMLKEKE